MDMNKILNDWTHADDYLDKKYESTKAFVDNMIAPEFIVDEKEVSTKVVPEDCSKAAVSMIGGKTAKSKNLIPFPYWRPSGYTTGGATFTCDDDGVITITTEADGVTGNCYFSITRDTAGHIAPVVSGKTYTLRATSNVETSNVRFNYKYFNKSTSTERDGGVHKEVNNTITFVYEPQENEVILIQVYCNIGAKPNGEVIKIQLEEGSEATAYEPYFEGLHSAPVEKVVSLSKNFFEGEYTNLYPAQNTGKVTVGTLGVSTSIISKVIPNTKILIKKIDEIGNRCRVATYTEKPDVGMLGNQYASDQYANEMIITTGENDNWILVYVDQVNAKKPRMYVGKYPYNKDTLSLVDITKNLPDYGCSAGDVYNYIDFDEMKYHHNVGSVDMGTLTVTTTSTADCYNCGSLSPTGKAATINMISDKYETTGTHDDFISMDKSIRIASDGITLSLHDSSYTSGILDGIIVNYELATPEEIPLALFLPFIQVESGGTIEFVNEHNLDVPNTVLYKKEVL